MFVFHLRPTNRTIFLFLVAVTYSAARVFSLFFFPLLLSLFSIFTIRKSLFFVKIVEWASAQREESVERAGPFFKGRGRGSTLKLAVPHINKAFPAHILSNLLFDDAFQQRHNKNKPALLPPELFVLHEAFALRLSSSFATMNNFFQKPIGTSRRVPPKIPH